MVETDNTESVSGLTDLRELLSRDVDLAPVHELYDVGHGVSPQLQAEVLQPQDDRALDVLFAQLVLEEPAAGGHHDLVNIDVMVLADDVQVHQPCLEPELLELLAYHPAVVLHLDAHRCDGPRAHLGCLEHPRSAKKIRLKCEPCTQKLLILIHKLSTRLYII